MADNVKELEKILVQMGKNPSKDMAGKLMEKLDKASVIVPALMPRDTPPDILKSIIQSGGGQMQLPSNLNPQPGILQNDSGEQFVAVYTTERELNRNGNKNAFPLILNMPFSDCVEIVAQNKDDIDGIVINPFSHNVVLRMDGNGEEEELEGPQLHAALRRRLETLDLPKSLFDGGEKAVKGFNSEGASYILDLYNELYDGDEACPYDESDFDFMTLGISDTLLLTRVAMPSANNYTGTSRAVFAAWNPLGKTLLYYTIEKKSQSGECQIVNVSKDGALSVVDDAPDEGSELQCIIDLATGQKNN